jgi:RNA polymerase sigma factor (TIGR02999 family)
MSDVSVWIRRAAQGDRAAFDQAFEAIRRELKAVAVNRLRADSRSTLSPTMLINETWLKLADSEIKALGREHFFRIAAAAMRQVWIDRQRSRLSELERIRLYQDGTATSEDLATWVELIDWETAMRALQDSDPELAELVDLRVFSGLELDEIAALKNTSLRTVQRHWKSARAFLLHAA